MRTFFALCWIDVQRWALRLQLWREQCRAKRAAERRAVELLGRNREIVLWRN